MKSKANQMLGIVLTTGMTLAAQAETPVRVWDFESGTVGENATEIVCSTGEDALKFVRADGNYGTATFSDAVPCDTVGGSANTEAVCISKYHNTLTTYKIVSAKSALGLEGSSFTIECFLKIDYAARWANVLKIANGSSCTLSIQANSDGDTENRFRLKGQLFSASANANVDGGSVCFGDWFHLAVVCDAATVDAPVLKMYVNGQSIGSAALSGAVHWDDAAILGFLNAIRGSTDHLRITPRALTPGEMLISGVTLHNATVTPMPDEGVVWRFEDVTNGVSVKRTASTLADPKWDMTIRYYSGSVYDKAVGTEDLPYAIASSYPDSLTPTPSATLENSRAMSLTAYGVAGWVQDAKHFFALNGNVGELTPWQDKSFTLQAWVKPSTTMMDRTELFTIHRLNTHKTIGLVLRNSGGVCYFMSYFDVERIETTSSGTDGYNTSLGASGTTAIPFDAWSHIAVSYDHSKTNVTLFVNGVAKATTTLLHSPLFDNPSSDIKIFNGYIGAIDDLHLTGKALGASEIDCNVYDPKAPLASPTRFHWRFEDAARTSSVNAAWLPTPTVNGSPAYAASAPTAESIPFKYRDADMTKALRDDVGAADLPAGAKVNYGNLARAGVLSNFTVEAFLRIPDASVLGQWPTLLHWIRPTWTGVDEKKTKMDGKRLWALAFGRSGSGTAESPYLFKPKVLVDCCPTNVAPVVNENWNQSFMGPDGIADGSWHHVAFTYDRASNTFTGYTDYVPWPTTFSPAYALPLESCKFSYGETTGGQQCGWEASEIRISDRVLSPRDFLHEYKPASGLSITIR